MKVSSLRDIVAIEQADPNPFASLTCTYDMIGAGAAINPDATALSFFLRTEDYATPAIWTYAQWHQDITRWLITLGPVPVSEVWDRVEAALRSPHGTKMQLQGILAVNALRHFTGSPPGSSSTERAGGLPESLAGGNSGRAGPQAGYCCKMPCRSW